MSKTFAAIMLSGVVAAGAVALSSPAMASESAAAGTAQAPAGWIYYGVMPAYQCAEQVNVYMWEGVTAQCRWHAPMSTNNRELWVLS